MPTEDWRRLADLLVARRVQLGYLRRAQLLRAKNAGHFERIALDVENAKRNNYDKASIAMVERIYGWQPGSVRAVLTGGEPVTADETVRGDDEDAFVAEAGEEPEAVSNAEVLEEIKDMRRVYDQRFDSIERRLDERP
jgi:hypothetical protein